MKKVVKKKAVKKKPTQKIEYKISLGDFKSDPQKEQDEKNKIALLAGKAKKALIELFQLQEEVESFIVIATTSKRVSRLSHGDLSLVIAEIERAKLEMMLPFVRESN